MTPPQTELYINPVPTLPVKVCRICAEPKAIDFFHRRKKNRDGRQNACAECTKNLRSVYTQNNQEKLRDDAKKLYQKNKERILKTQEKFAFKKYGVDSNWYDDTISEQGGVCAICRGSETGGVSKRFSIDHDHKCCGIKRACEKCRRGLLCYSCNLKLGHLENDTWKRQAIAYLNKYNKKNKPESGQELLF